MKLKLFTIKNLEPIVVAPVQQPQDMDEEDRLALRAAAQLELQTSLAMRDRIMTEITTSARWVQASLLLVNGAAAVATLQADALPLHARGIVGAAFVTGLLFSLLSAYIGIHFGQDVPRRFSEIGGYWLRVTIDLLRSEEIEKDWFQYGRDRARISMLSQVPGWISLFAFLVGCGIAGTYLI
jgi:hypothetical protein